MASSVYEDREFGWRDRLHRLLRRSDPDGRELIGAEDGNYQLVTSRGKLLGLRRRDGSVAPIPEQPVEQWLNSDWGDTEWVLVGGRWRERWR